MKDFFNKEKETNYVVTSVNEEVISDTYNAIEKEIESLRKYDKGEKDIDAQDLTVAVRSVR
ncbi:MAG: hypothetical protein O3A36_01415 [bacterium]|nr:hypothetical protein [bacterium]